MGFMVVYVSSVGMSHLLFLHCEGDVFCVVVGHTKNQRRGICYFCCWNDVYFVMLWNVNGLPVFVPLTALLYLVPRDIKQLCIALSIYRECFHCHCSPKPRQTRKRSLVALPLINVVRNENITKFYAWINTRRTRSLPWTQYIMGVLGGIIYLIIYILFMTVNLNVLGHNFMLFSLCLALIVAEWCSISKRFSFFLTPTSTISKI